MPAAPHPDRDALDAAALDLRMAGHTYQAIANRVPGIGSSAAAHKAVARALDRLGSGGQTDELNLILARLDELHQALWPKARAGSTEHIDRVLKVEERRARVLDAVARARAAATATATEKTPTRTVDDIGQRMRDYLAGVHDGQQHAVAGAAAAEGAGRP